MSPCRAWRFLVLALACATVPFPGGAAETRSAPRVEAFYFHRTLRCPACLDMENFTAEAVGRFAAACEAGRLRWRIVNLDDEENRHYVRDYAIEFNSVVLSRQVNGQEVAWTNLPDAWKFIGDKPTFIAYVESEILLQLERLPKE